MKKLVLLTAMLLFVVSSAYAVDFAPTLLKLSADPIIQYDFDGSNLDIPVQVSGRPAGIIFCVYSRGEAANINNVVNGFLGWHTVNKVDTCIYYSKIKSVDIGATTISWDGKDQDGGVVPPGEYTYYLWAYDNQTPKVRMSNWLHSGWGFGQSQEIVEVDEQGLPMANPIWYRSSVRWKIGSDPMDSTLVEESNINRAEGWSILNDPKIDPFDHDYVYFSMRNNDSGTGALQKYKWVPGGDAEVQSDWGESGWSEMWGKVSGSGSAGVATDGTYLYTTDENHTASSEADSELYIFDFEGYMVEEIDLTGWFSDPDALAAGGQMNGGPNNFSSEKGYLFLNCHCNCLLQMTDPIRYLDSGELDDLQVWMNRNGDYTLDHNFEETAALPWVCNDYNVGVYKYSVDADASLFSIANAWDCGAVSFGLCAPDGTGLGYYAFSGETAGWKKGSVILDTDTPFDGIYCDNQQTGGPKYDLNAEKIDPGIHYTGHDTISGVISSAVSVEDEAPAAFSVAQNSPNPFNPTTTISFSLADAGNVTVEVYNIAGQKVDTLIDNFVEAGSHSVVWDASDLSAGVYFYTVKSQGLSRTMKMTLLK